MAQLKPHPSLPFDENQKQMGRKHNSNTISQPNYPAMSKNHKSERKIER